MSHELDRRLIQALADAYPERSSIRRILHDADVPRGNIDWESRPRDTWYSALAMAREHKRSLELLDCVVEEFPENAVFQAARYEESQTSGAAASSPVTWLREIPGGELEKLMGNQSTLLPISFLNIGLQRAKAVARVCRGLEVGTGFLVSNDLFVTNNHVLKSKNEAAEAIAEFGYDRESGENGYTDPIEVRLCPSRGFITSQEHDITIVRAEAGVGDQWGTVPVNPPNIKETAWVNIIQHADGKAKSIALYHNMVLGVNDDVVQYYTDTLPGSSGSPVFDSSWNLVAVHHSGGKLYEPGSTVWKYLNEGINAKRLVGKYSEVL